MMFIENEVKSQVEKLPNRNESFVSLVTAILKECQTKVRRYLGNPNCVSKRNIYRFLEGLTETYR
jgi:hypothetical protein